LCLVNAHLLVAIAGTGEGDDNIRARRAWASNQDDRSHVLRRTITFCTFPSTILLAYISTQMVFSLSRQTEKLFTVLFAYKDVRRHFRSTTETKKLLHLPKRCPVNSPDIDVDQRRLLKKRSRGWLPKLLHSGRISGRARQVLPGMPQGKLPSPAAGASRILMAGPRAAVGASPVTANHERWADSRS
jgi:hypothetical protein